MLIAAAMQGACGNALVLEHPRAADALWRQVVRSKGALYGNQVANDAIRIRALHETLTLAGLTLFPQQSAPCSWQIGLKSASPQRSSHTRMQHSRHVSH